MGWDDAVQREVDWLTSIAADMPGLTADQGGPWDLVLPYGRAAGTVTTGRYLWVAREGGNEMRFAIQQKIHVHRMRLRLIWPVRANHARPEDDLALLDAAVADVLTRVRGPVGDHTHGGRFLDAAEGGMTEASSSSVSTIEVEQDDPEKAAEASKSTVTIKYLAVDRPFTA